MTLARAHNQDTVPLMLTAVKNQQLVFLLFLVPAQSFMAVSLQSLFQACYRHNPVLILIFIAVIFADASSA